MAELRADSESKGDRISKLESELELLKSMGAPTDGSGDNSNLLGALSEMLKKLEEKLTSKIIDLDEKMKDFVKQPEFKQTITSLEERKADRSELRKLHDLMELLNNKPTGQVQVVKETVIAAE